MALTLDFRSLCYNFLSFKRLNGVDKIMNLIFQICFSGL